MTDPGIHDLTPVTYYADEIADEPSLNASIAKVLLNESPRHAWEAHPRLNPQYRDTFDRKYDVGTVVHEVFLLDNAEKVAVVDANDWRSKVAQTARDEAREQGQIPLLAREWAQVQEMLDALRHQVAGHEAQPSLFSDGKPEQTVIWRENGVLCRCRIDWLRDDHAAIDDLKTSKWTANPQAWARRTMWSIGADIQAAFYIRAVKSLTGVEPVFRLVVVETAPPFALSVVTPSPAALALANAKVDAAIAKWSECLASDVWPGYSSQVLTVDPPGWAESQWWEQQQLDEQAAA